MCFENILSKSGLSFNPLCISFHRVVLIFIKSNVNFLFNRSYFVVVSKIYLKEIFKIIML